MARARNIKPGFFVNDGLLELDFASRLLFIGLWTLADKAGRLEDRPKKIKIGVFPVDNVDITVMLQDLHDGGFVKRYEVNGEKYIQIVNWEKHQRPHHTEKESEIPDESGVLTVKEPSDNGRDRLGNHQNPPDSLIPDTGFTDSLIPEEEAKASLSPSKLPDCPHVEIINLFAEKLPMLPQPKAELWDGQRAKNLRARWAWVLTAKKSKGENAGQPYATDKASALAWFSRYFAYVADQCPHLTGNNDRAWTADLAWLMKSDNFGKVLQGNYQREAA